ncbi:hypothetical protein KIN20_005562 [Parelaphostrongylus tenuis]|uniref:Uncharacterized protein n=1 Tax=Parelaphostrongylus tenuis TaxID=148309 RepID=A0AAD5QG64_PARTN|nr:hypothetical protein KIN20_005562 [Parelaphostrongylus tenuis]
MPFYTVGYQKPDGPDSNKRSYFVDPHLSGAPGFMICATFIAAFVMQLCICMCRTFRTIFSKTIQYIVPVIVTQVTIGMAFLLSIHITVTITQDTKKSRHKNLIESVILLVFMELLESSE